MVKITGETKFWLKLGAAALGIAASIALCGIAVWGFTVVIAEPKGAGDAHKKVNEAPNRIRAQEHFYTLYNQIKAYDQQLDQAELDMVKHPDDDYFAINYSGLRKQCLDAVNQYNGDTRKVTKAKWLDPELPYEIDFSKDETDCMPSTVTR